MKRVTLLCLISAAFIYNILPQPEGVTQIDQIKTKMAAARGRPDERVSAIHRVSASLVADPVVTESPSVSENAAVSEIEPDGSEIAHVDEVPWDEIKQGWKNDLKEFLMEADPDHGEETYTAYLEESESFEAEIDSLSREAEKAGKEARQDFETLIGQLEVKHEEKLKEILGAYYSDVTDRHQQYNASIQYMNRSDADIVGVSL
ncbi:MAG: hypothetical protein V4598_03820 [Bdellovibrionota bacterium]